MRSVEALRSIEKINIEKLSHAITKNGAYFHSFHSSDAPSTTGRSGSTQGASTVRTQAKKAIISNVITYFLVKYLISISQ